ncbi:unnamed protein product [Nesidiocoris tenuis]|uniref:Uncharacterized protein n=1 Tax=Nesidiocoris tenuis TaxID=355587 RepID=A0A6H5GA82_9HEMI|nr:unnamed protein product [Nesidiocoris tenuis]
MEKKAKKKKNAARKSGSARSSRRSGSSGTTRSIGKKKKERPISRKEREKRMKEEKALKERILTLRKEANAMLAEFSAMEEAAARKAATEAAEQEKRVDRLASVCDNVRFAKCRLVHEHNKLRDAAIWKRFINTDQQPYPEVTQNMHTHLHLYKQKKSSEYMEFSLGRMSQMIGSLCLLSEMIQHPLYASDETVENWKEVRKVWRAELLEKWDRCSFNKMADLKVNFPSLKDTDLSSVYHYEESVDNLSLGLTVWYHKENHPLFGLVFPKIPFASMDIQIQMPSSYRTAPFAMRLIHLSVDIFSDSSKTFELSDVMPLEPDFLHEVKRWFEVKKEAKAAVADREREKVRAAKQKVQEAQAAAADAEKSFETMQQKTSKRLSPAANPSMEDAAAEELPKARKVGKDLLLKLDTPSEGGRRRPRGVWDEGERGSLATSLMYSEGAQKALDTISMKSGMRRKGPERFKQEFAGSGDFESAPASVFHTPSMTSVSQRRPKVEVRRASELCFEEDDDDEMSAGKIVQGPRKSSVFSFDSLDFMFGESEDFLTMKTLVKNTTLVQREMKTRSATKNSADFRSGRKRGKSLMSKKLTNEFDLPQTASELFEEREETRQDRYMSTLLTTVYDRHQINLRAYQSVGGVFLLDLFYPVDQPQVLSDGNRLQIFCGPLDVRRDPYNYNYYPLLPNFEEGPNERPADPQLQNLFLVKAPLPENVVFFEPPIVAMWDKDVWVRSPVHNLVVDFEAKRSTFYIERPLPFAYFIKKYSLLPLIKWNMKPNFASGGVQLSLMTQNVHFQFEVLGFAVSLSSVQGVPAEIADSLSGKFTNTHELIGKMKNSGLDIFPDEDAFLYCAENLAKDPVLEDHIYMAIAMFSDTLEFHSSQWNNDFKRRKASFQVREASRLNVELRYRTATAAVDCANLYRCNDDEEADRLDETKIEKLGFNPDVYNLLQSGFAHAMTATLVDPVQVVAVYDLLSRTKLLSYCGFNKKEANSSSSGSSKKSPKKGKRSFKSKARSDKVPGSRSSRTSSASLNRPSET